MFYSPQILSHKNKTEISLVYYVSTVKYLKKQFKKEVIDSNFSSILDKITNFKAPLALRLYSYLLNGLVKMWIIKVEHYRTQFKCIRREKRIFEKNSKISNVNLRIVDQYISDIEDFSNSHEIQSIKEEIPQSFLSRLENCNFDDAVEFESINFNNENTVKKIKKNQIDKEIFLTAEDIYADKIQIKRFEFPILNNSEIIEKFSKFLNENLISNVKENEPEYFECDSIEDPRISSSASVDKNVRMISSDIDCPDLKIFETRALSFYNILVEASEGLITVLQNGPFEIIEIHSPIGISYFN